MKKRTLTLLIAGIFLQSFGQTFDLPESAYLTDSIIHTRKVYGFPERVIEKEAFKYTAFNKVYRYEVYTNIFDGLDGIDWKKKVNSNYTYDKQGNLLKMLREKRAADAEEWNNDLMSVYTYEGNDSIVMHHDWFDSAWRQRARWTYTWNPDKFEWLTLYQSWDTIGEFWENQFRFDTVFTADDQFDTIRSLNWNMQGEADTVFHEAFDYTQFPDTIISYQTYQSFFGDFFVRKQYYDPDSNANVDFVAVYVDSTGSYRDFNKRFYFLDANQNVIRDDAYTWDTEDIEWRFSYRVDYHYNADNLMDEKVNYFPGSIFMIAEELNYFYNENQLLSRKVYYLYPINDEVYDKYEYYYSLFYVGLPEDPAGRQTIAWPNPAQNLLFIDNSKFVYRQYQIHDLSGRLVKSDKLYREHEMIDISSLPAGNYVLSMQGNGAAYSQQLIKRK